VRAVSLHRDVIVVTSRLVQTNCTIIRGEAASAPQAETVACSSSPGASAAEPGTVAETFIVDSPILPDELELLPSLLDQAGYPQPSGLLATHGDWDHLLGPLAFPGLPLGCAESTAERLAAEPGAAQRKLREFDEQLYIDRARPLGLGSFEGLPVPGRLEIGAAELELHPASGHTADGMVIRVPWAGVLVAGDYLSNVEIPMISESGDLGAYTQTLERMRPLVSRSEHVVPGHGHPLRREGALRILEEDAAYLRDLAGRGADAELPAGRRSREQRRIHAANVALCRREG
jgi:glyoxylase-like metal-dependent hydrolase (beta-lactamase superfamily II)